MSEKRTGGILALAIQAVVSVFAAFGGLVVNIQPPEEAYRGFSIGFAGVLSALVLLLLSAVGRQAADSVPYNRICLVLGALLIAGVGVTGTMYQNLVLTRTVDMPSVNGGKAEKVAIGTDFTPAAKTWVGEHPCSIKEPYSCSNKYLFVHFGEDARELVWTRDSILASVEMLNNLYLAFAVLMSSAVFVLGECLGEHFLKAKDARGI
jgi:hypothetical protein